MPRSPTFVPVHEETGFPCYARQLLRSTETCFKADGKILCVQLIPNLQDTLGTAIEKINKALPRPSIKSVLNIKKFHPDQLLRFSKSHPSEIAGL